MVAVAGVSGFALPGTREAIACGTAPLLPLPACGERSRHTPCGPRNRPIDASVTIRIGFEQMSNVAGGQQGYVKVDKPTLNEPLLKRKITRRARPPQQLEGVNACRTSCASRGTPDLPSRCWRRLPRRLVPAR